MAFPPRRGNDLGIRLRACKSRPLSEEGARRLGHPSKSQHPSPNALNYRGYATRKLGRTDEGISYYLKSVALDPAYPAGARISRRSLRHPGATEFDLAKDQLSTIEKLCGKGCEYYQDLSETLEQAHAL